ncbi:SIR2 family protein [Hungatella sp.]|uniref:SIR2 family protein n=1 Tax=Hungatella sp. TaxID=2613924 RepID=UPI002A8072AE|nr:SIR2 family protein [Hungatella sp.]
MSYANEKIFFIKEISEALFHKRCDYFIGSGISAASGVISWSELLKTFTEPLGILLKDHSDLPQIAQYIVNSYSGNKGILINHIIKSMQQDYPLNNYHQAIASTNLSCIWTTNYDTLLEKALCDFRLDIKADEDSVIKSKNNADIELIKLHGCIEHGNRDQIVITSEDYEDFFQNKPSMSQRLCNDMIRKSFLFIGYGYRDPNIRNIMVAARRLSGKMPQNHYMILDCIKKDSETDLDFEIREKELRLWLSDLRRFGLETLIIDNYDELYNILHIISQKSRGKTVYVSGSHCDVNDTAYQLGLELEREKEVILINGQSSGIGASVCSAFMTSCVQHMQDMNKRTMIYPNPYSVDPSYSDKPELIPSLKRERTPLFRATQLFICFPGGMGTLAELEIAVSRHCKILPVIIRDSDYGNKVIQFILSDCNIMNNLELCCPDYVAVLNAKEIPALPQIFQSVKRLLS